MRVNTKSHCLSASRRLGRRCYITLPYLVCNLNCVFKELGESVSDDATLVTPEVTEQ